MSRTEEDILSRVDVPIMRNTTLSTYPTSYSELCDTFRPRLGSARRTDSGRERFIDFLVPSPVRGRFVAEHASEAEGVPFALQIAALQRHPAQRAPATPAQERPVPLTAGLGVLLGHGVDGARKWSVVAEIPDEIAGARLAVKQSGERLDAVSIHQQQRRKLMRSQGSDKTSKLTETPIFRTSNSVLQERDVRPAASAGVSVPERR
jgi:hypothetical protein